MGNTKKQKHALLRKKKTTALKKKLFDNKKQNSVDIKTKPNSFEKNIFFSQTKTFEKKKNLQNIEKPSSPKKKPRMQNIGLWREP